MVSLPKFCGAVELRPSFAPRPEISHVVFDFDGTLSWLRHGWPEVMVRVFRPHFPAQPGESEGVIHDLLMNLIVSLNGRPTIFQTLRFAELVKERGGASPDGETLRQEYQHRLDEAIAERTKNIHSGKSTSDAYVVHGARFVLDKLRRAGITPVILSSTVEERVREEAQLLGLSDYFGLHIFGGTGDPTKFSKMDVFKRLLRTEGVTGRHLLSFGDGPVEIANTKELGGVAIAVCSDEHHNGSGLLDPFKQRQLLDAGADAAVPDYRDVPALLGYLLQR
ncbi:MAG: HAD family hydrolase [Verrucomicrobia bacterium]|nr:HAD family hydrolase [Verrucomicrobiota bacterium]